MQNKDAEGRQSTKVFGWLSLFAGFVALGSAGWVLGLRHGLSGWHGFPNTASTTLLMLAVAAINIDAPPRYKWSIVAGLGFSTAGDALLMHSSDYFVPGLFGFLGAHLCYLWAFTRDSRLAGRRLPFVLWGGIGMVLLPCVWPGVAGPLRLPVVLYATALLVMAAQAAGRALVRRDTASVLGAIGAALFVVSDSILAFQRFRHPLEWGGVLVLGTYFAAQSGIALSVLLHGKKV